MTTCDIAAISKPWNVQYEGKGRGEREWGKGTYCTMTYCTYCHKPWNVQLRAANLVITEFFDQGDKERHQLKIQPQVNYILQH